MTVGRAPLPGPATVRSVVTGENPRPIPRESNYTETGKHREIDRVTGDEDSLVGYESRYDDSLKRRQLRDELAKLELNAERRETKLVTVPSGLLSS